MMLPTHILVGLAVATPVLVLAPEYASVALAGGLLGSVIPDFDMYSDHRRFLHYPTGYTLVAVAAVAIAALVGTALLVTIAFLFIGAALHCRMDRYGGGLELRPWEATSEVAVFDHVRGRWRRPKRWIRYDGAPEDVLLAILLGVPLFVVLTSPFKWVAAGALLVGCTYGILRRRLADLAPHVFEKVPEPIIHHVPQRYRV